MYKIVDTISHEILLGNEKGVIQYAQERLDEDKYWKDDYHWELKRNGISDKIRTFQGAVKMLGLKYVEIIDIGDIITSLNNNKYVSISTEE